jgi:hypothetical protein
MTIYRCDLCGKDISTANAVVKVGYHGYGFFGVRVLRRLRQTSGAVSHARREEAQEQKRVPCCGYYLKKRMKRLEDAVAL